MSEEGSDLIGMYHISSIAVDVIMILFIGRVLLELAIWPRARYIEALIHLPVLFFCVLHSIGFMGQTMIYMGGSEISCEQSRVKILAHIGIFGGLGFIPGLMVPVYIPFLIFKKSEKLMAVDFTDLVVSFLLSLSATLIAWVSYLLMEDMSFEESLINNYINCSVKFDTIALIVCLETLIFSGSIFYLWLRGLKIYFEAVYHIDDMGAAEVIRRASENSVGFSEFLREREIARSMTPGRYSSYFGTGRFSSHIGNMPASSSKSSLSRSNSHKNVRNPSRGASSARESADFDVELTEQIYKVVDTYGNQFRRCWFFVVMNLLGYMIAIIFELCGVHMGSLWFVSPFIIKTCGYLSCWLFFQTDRMKKSKRTICPHFGYQVQDDEDKANAGTDEEDDWMDDTDAADTGENLTPHPASFRSRLRNSFWNKFYE